MDLFLNGFSHEPGVRDVAFCDSLKVYLDALSTRGEIAGYRLTRRKLTGGLLPRAQPRLHSTVRGAAARASLPRGLRGVLPARTPSRATAAALDRKVLMIKSKYRCLIPYTR
jgi:hypothetical protein